MPSVARLRSQKPGAETDRAIGLAEHRVFELGLVAGVDERLLGLHHPAADQVVEHGLAGHVQAEFDIRLFPLRGFPAAQEPGGAPST